MKIRYALLELALVGSLVYGGVKGVNFIRQIASLYGSIKQTERLNEQYDNVASNIWQGSLEGRTEETRKQLEYWKRNMNENWNNTNDSINFLGFNNRKRGYK